MRTGRGIEWQQLLDNLNRLLIEEEGIDYIVQQYENKWLGSPAASESTIYEAERRLKTQLPDSYRSFLLTSNGWGPIDTSVTRLLTVNELNWRSSMDEEGGHEAIKNMIDLSIEQKQDERPSKALNGYLQISEPGESTVLLNSSVRGDDGEWEVLYVAPWAADVYRYPSFFHLMEHMLDEAKD